MKKAYNIIDHHYDVIVVGAGGAGLRATLGVAESGLKTVYNSGYLTLLLTVLATLFVWML